MLHDLANELITVLRAQARSLAALCEALLRNRSSFVALGAKHLEAGTEKLDGHVHNVGRLEQRREEVVDKLQEELGASGDLRVSILLPLLPREQATALRQASDAAGEAARRVHAECQVGTRLLRLSEQVNAGIIESLLGLNRDNNARYDCNARSEPAGVPGGSIVSSTA